MNAAVLIPAYQPGGALTDVVRALSGRAFRAIVVVDDGSGAAFRAGFDRIEALPNVRVLRHHQNLGKGAALKTGIAWLQKALPGLAGVVTADADGQHHPDDIERVAQALAEQPDRLVLGARGFEGRVPPRSRVGNALSRLVMRAVVGQRLADTQTGLRGIPARLLPHLLGIEANGYEFELEMLIAARRLSVAVWEVPVRTIYQDGNRASHFSPLVDSMKVWFVLLRFASVSLATAVLDNVVFYLAWRRTGHILAAQIMGRVLAVAFNYWMVRRSVFYSRQRHRAVLPRYLMLVLILGTVSYGGIQLLAAKFGMHPVAAKLLVETVLFFANFAVQRLLIFDEGAGAGESGSVLAWVVFVILAAVAAIEIYGFATGRLFAPDIWMPGGIRRLVRYCCLFAEGALPLLLLAPWMFAGTAATLLLAGSAVAAPAGLPAASFFLLSAWTLGTKLVRGAGAACAILAGTAVYIFLMTCTARLPVNYPLAWAAVLAIPIALDPRLAWRGLARLAATIRAAPLRSGRERAAFAALALVVGMHWLVALKPENGADALAMHLAIPVDMALDHRMTFEPGRFLWSVMPMGADWAYSITYLLGGEAAPRLLNFAFLVLLLAMLYEAMRRWVPRATAFLLLAVFATTPLVQLATGSLFVENLLAALLVGAAVSLWRYAETGEAGFLCLASGLGGAALNVKLGAAAMLVMLAPFAIWEARRHRLRWRNAALALVLFLAAGLPVYAYAWRATGDPLFPFLNRKFPSPLLDRSVVIRDGRFRQPLTWHTPFDLTFRTHLFYEGQNGSIGFQYLLLVPLSLLALVAVRRAARRREPVSATAAALGAMAVVLATEPNARYLYPAMPLLLIPTAALLGQLRNGRRALDHTLIVCLIACAAMNVYFMPASGWWHKQFYSQLVFTPHGRERILREEMPIRDVTIHFLRAHPGAHVLFAAESDLADTAGEAYIPGWHQYHVWESVQRAAGPADLARLLDRWQVGYVIAPVQGRVEFPALRALLDCCATREYEDRSFYLAKVDGACAK